jgi:hypothetical protein
MKEIVDPEIAQKRALLFNYWKNIPTICEMKASDYKIACQEVRNTILDILRQGVMDESPEDKTKKMRRHALSAQECQKYVSERLERRVKLSNIYFHLKRLMELGFIQAITTIKGKRQDIVYYGRTAQLFHFGGSEPDNKSEYEEKLHNTIGTIIRSLNPTVKEEKITERIDTIITYQTEQKKARSAWIANNSDLLNSLEFDILDIDKFLDLLAMSTQEGYQLATEFKKLLKFTHE